MHTRLMLLVAALAAAPTGAQEVAVGGSVHFPLGDRYEFVERGRAVGFHIAFGQDQVQLGIGGELLSYDVEDSRLDVEGAEAFGFVRYRYGSAPVRPVFGLRAGYVYHRIDGDPRRPSVHGFAIGPIAGIQIPAGPVAIEIIGEALIQAFQEPDAPLPVFVPGEDSGYRAGVRLMLVVPLGG